MISEEALRFLAHQAKRCRDRDSAESLCLLLPAMMRLLCLEAMDDFEALDFHLQLRTELREQWLPERSTTPNQKQKKAA